MLLFKVCAGNLFIKIFSIYGKNLKTTPKGGVVFRFCNLSFFGEISGGGILIPPPQHIRTFISPLYRFVFYLVCALRRFLAFSVSGFRVFRDFPTDGTANAYFCKNLFIRLTPPSINTPVFAASDSSYAFAPERTCFPLSYIIYGTGSPT